MARRRCVASETRLRLASPERAGGISLKILNLTQEFNQWAPATIFIARQDRKRLHFAY